MPKSPWTSASNGVSFSAVTASVGGGSGSGGTVTVGTLADLPTTVPLSGSEYICTDSPYSFVSSGSLWIAKAGGELMVPPSLSAFSQVNFGTSTTASAAYGGIVLTDTVGSVSDACRGLVHTNTATNYKIVACISTDYFYTPSIACSGLLLRNSSTGKGIVFRAHASGLAYITTVNSMTSSNSNPASMLVSGTDRPSKWWMSLDVSAGSAVFRLGHSRDRRYAFSSYSITGWVGAVDQVGIFATGSEIWCMSYEYTSS